MDKPIIYRELGEPDFSRLNERDRKVIARVIDLRDQGHLVDVGMDWTRHHAFVRQQSGAFPHIHYPDQED